MFVNIYYLSLYLLKKINVSYIHPYTYTHNFSLFVCLLDINTHAHTHMYSQHHVVLMELIL